jgi:hypothetical protein
VLHKANRNTPPVALIEDLLFRFLARQTANDIKALTDL